MWRKAQFKFFTQNHQKTLKHRFLNNDFKFKKISEAFLKMMIWASTEKKLGLGK
jgi:hypothetical protein